MGRDHKNEDLDRTTLAEDVNVGSSLDPVSHSLCIRANGARNSTASLRNRGENRLRVLGQQQGRGPSEPDNGGDALADRPRTDAAFTRSKLNDAINA